mgnify:CR=1 FL=1
MNLLDEPLTYTFWITRWREIVEEAQRVYTEQQGHPPADSDIGHFLFRAFEDRRGFSPRWPTLRQAWNVDVYALIHAPASRRKRGT